MTNLDPLNPLHHASANGPANARSGGPVIVIADDEAHIRLVVGEKFRSEGFTVLEARDGEEALDLVRTHKPDALVTDLQMPYMNGLELCAQVAADPATAHIPALLLTARGHIVDPSQMERTAIRKTMAKPFSAKALVENVQAILGASGEAAGAAPAAVFPRTVTGEAA